MDFAALRASWQRLALGAATAAAAVALSPGEAQAVLTYNIFESGSNLVVQASGSLTGLARRVDIGGTGSPKLLPGLIVTGSNAQANSAYKYDITGPSGFGGSAGLVSGLGSGSYTALQTNTLLFWLDSQYTSGSAISSSATFANQTLAGQGFNTPGLIGTWTLTNGGDTIRVVVGAPTSPAAPAPGPLPLFGAGAAFAWSRRLRRRIGSAELTASRL